jgi:hypothetical protein
MDNLLWLVAHTRPCCEKKLDEYCGREGFPVTRPCYRSVKKHHGKTAIFPKPLFPGYVYLRPVSDQRQRVGQSRSGMFEVLLRLDFIGPGRRREGGRHRA